MAKKQNRRTPKSQPSSSTQAAAKAPTIPEASPWAPSWLLRPFAAASVEYLPAWLQSLLSPQPLHLHKINLRSERWHLLALSLVLLAVYAWTSPRSVALEDDSLFALASYFYGVAHPPGYPIHTLLGKIFTWLPIGTVAYRVHMLSAVLAALACCTIYLLLRGLLERRSYAYLGALAYGFSRTFWSQAIIGEVYTLNSLFFFVILFLCLQLRSLSIYDPTWRRGIAWLGAVYGLSLANHWPLIFLSTPGLALIVLPQAWGYLRWWWRWLLPMVLCAVLPYCWLFLRSTMDPVISFYGPINSWGLAKIFMSRKGYAGVDNQEGVTWDDKVEFIQFLGQESAEQITWVGCALALLGAVYWFRRSGWLAGFGLLVIFLCNTVLLTILLNFRAEDIFFAAFQVYPATAYGLIALCSSVGLYLVFRLAQRYLERGGNLPAFKRWRQWQAAAALLLVLAVLGSHWQANDRHAYSWARDYAVAILHSLKPNSDLFINNDIMTATGYFNLIEQVRPDVRIFSGQGLSFNTRLYHAVAPRSFKNNILKQYVDSRSHPIYYTNEMEHGYGQTSMLEFFLIEKGLDANVTNFEFPVPLVELLLKYLDNPPEQDDWSRVHYSRVINSAMYHIGNMMMHNHEGVRAPRLQQLYEQLRELYPLKQMEVLRSLNLGLVSKDSLESYSDWLVEQEALISSKKPEMLDIYHYLRGIISYRLDDFAASIASLEQSVRQKPDQSNAAVISLLEYYLHYRNVEGYQELRRLITDPEAFTERHQNFPDVEAKMQALIERLNQEANASSE